MKALISTTATFLCRLLSVIVGVAIAILAVAVLVQIVTREAFRFSILPLDDLIPYSFSISTFAGAALLFKDKGHIAITVFSDIMPEKLRRIVVAFSECVIVGFLLFFLIYGIEFWMGGRFQYSPLLGIRLFYVYAIVPLAGFSGLVFILDNYFSPVSEPPAADSARDKSIEQV